MKAVVFHKHGGINVLKYEDHPDPVIRDDEVLVKVRACALNHLDIWVRGGLRGVKIPLPHISGCDISGEVADVGKLVDDVNINDKIMVSPGVSCGRCEYCLAGNDNFCRSYSIIGGYDRNGGYAEYVSVPRENIISKPEHLSFEDAAAIPLTFLTAWHMLVGRANVRLGETVLVVAAGSGVGSAVLQIAKLHGATVIATAGTDEKLSRAKDLGADYTINHSTTDHGKASREITQRAGVDIVIDHVGKETWMNSINALKHGGRIVTCGATSGSESVMDIRNLYRRQLAIFGSFMGSKGELLELLQFVRAGRLKPVVDSILPMKDAAKAQERMENRRHFGKIVLKI